MSEPTNPAAKCTATECPLPRWAGSLYCQAHTASPPLRTDLADGLRRNDFTLGAGVRHLHLAGGLPKAKGT